MKIYFILEYFKDESIPKSIVNNNILTKEILEKMLDSPIRSNLPN